MTDEHIDYRSVEDLHEIAAGILDEVAVRDAGLLAAAAGRPQVGVLGDDALPDVPGQGSRPAALAGQEPRSGDGNKRLAWAAAEGPDVPDIATWLRQHLEGAS